jgi:hypothetical protein
VCLGAAVQQRKHLDFGRRWEPGGAERKKGNVGWKTRFSAANAM